MFKLIPFLTYAFVVSFTPGPNNIMTMMNATSFGLKKAYQFIFGVCSGFFIIMLISGYFNIALFNVMPTVKTYMGLIGAAYMLYLAYKIIKSTNSVKENKNEQLSSFTTGITMQFINPKAILYGITVMSSFIIPYYKSSIQLLLFSVFLAFVAFLSTSSWALFGAVFQRFLSKYRKAFNISMALLLIYSAISISGILHGFK